VGATDASQGIVTKQIGLFEKNVLQPSKEFRSLRAKEFSEQEINFIRRIP